MKKPALLLALLLLALSCSDGTLLARGRSRTKKNRDRTSGEAPYVCLDASIDLPACTFSAEAPDRETRDKSHRHRRGLSEALAAELDEENGSSKFGDSQAKSRAVVIVYKIERCIPSRLPFDLPICKEEDSVGRIVEVRRLFPFNVMGLSGYNGGTTLVFPEVDVDQWHRFVHGPWTSPANIEDIVDKVEGASGKNSRAELSSAEMPKAPKLKKVDSSISTSDKKKTMLRKLKKFDRRHQSRKLDESDVFTELPTVGKLRVTDDRRAVEPVSSYETRANRIHRLDDHRHQRDDRNIDPLAAERASFARRADEFPRAKALPYDPEKLRVPRIFGEFPYREAIVREPTSARRDGTPEDEKFNEDPRRLDDLPYAQVITYYPGEADRIGAVGEFPYNREPQRGRNTAYSGAFAQEPASSRPNRMLLEGDHNYRSPYAKFLRIPQDRKKLEIAKAGSEFPYARAIAYDPAKLRLASRVSESPYTKAIPYDPKKLFEESSRGIIDIGSSSLYSRGLKQAEDEAKSSKSQVVPFDSRMLDAAKEGRIFPYGKAIPEDTSRIVEVDLSRDTERIEAPARHAKTFRSERVPSFASSRQIGKDERMLEDVLNGREVRRNIIDTGNEDYLYELPMRGRVARSAMEPDAPRDSSFDNDNSETPRRWSEFPYSKAIPFDPSKLRRPRSTVEDYVEASIVAPQDFPYAKAIPYDPWKFDGFRRKKSEARRERTIDDESKLLEGLELSRLARFIF